MSGPVLRTERLTTGAAAAYRSTFSPDAPAPEPGGTLPPGWEGLLFPFDTSFADLRPDGSPAVDGVLPEIDLPRRLYAGEDTVFHRPLRYGDQLTQTVRAGDVVERTGRAGRLVFADLVRETRTGGELAVTSTWHDVFLDAADPHAPPLRTRPTPERAADWRASLRLDTRQLFRFSALTFNTHRVHYDRDWARGVERLDDLLVHGPLSRVLLLDAARRNHRGDVAAFSFTAVAPTFVDRSFRVEGRRIDERTTEVLSVDEVRGVLARGVVTWM